MLDTTKLPKEIELGTTLDDKKLMHLFVYFLKANNCYVQYRKNSRLEGNSFFFHFTSNDYVGYTKEILAKELINFAFTWELTPQGHSFWENINYEWKKLLGKYKLEIEHEF